MLTLTATLVLILIVGHHFYEKFRRKEEPDLFAEDHAKDENVQQALDSLIEKHGDRISVYQLHNGEQFYGSSKHIKFITNVKEAMAPGISGDMKHQQKMPSFIFGELLTFLYRDGTMFIPSVSLMPKGYFKDFLEEKGIQSCYCFAIKGIENHKKTIGILMLSYIKEEQKLAIEQIHELKMMSLKLTGYLE